MTTTLTISISITILGVILAAFNVWRMVSDAGGDSPSAISNYIITHLVAGVMYVVGGIVSLLFLALMVIDSFKQDERDARAVEYPAEHLDPN